MITVSVQDAQTRLEELVARAIAGEVVVIVRDDGAAVRLASSCYEAGPPTLSQPRFGSARGLFTMRDDFDAPLEDFRTYEP